MFTKPHMFMMEYHKPLDQYIQHLDYYIPGTQESFLEQMDKPADIAV